MKIKNGVLVYKKKKTKINEFNYNENIVQLELTKRVKEISRLSFAGCRNLRKVVFEQGSDLRGIEEDAFSECYKLSQIEFPRNLQYIGEAAFYCCVSLTQVVLPSNLEKIGRRAFNCCSSIEKVFLPMSLNLIGENAFDGCSSLQKYVVDSRNAFYKTINGN